MQAVELLQLVVCGLPDDLDRLAGVDPGAAELGRLGSSRSALERDAAALRGGGALYHAALAAGCDELLAHLVSAAAAVEAELAADLTLTAYHARSALRDFVVAVPAVASVAHAAAAGVLRGGSLLDELYARSADGDHVVRRVFQRLLTHAHQPLFAHLVRWMAYATIDDRGVEFFVRPGAAAVAAVRLVPAARAAGPRRGRAGAEPSDLRRLLAEQSWRCGHELARDNVPTRYVSRATAEAVLATGRVVGLLRAADDGGGGFVADFSAEAAAVLCALRAAPAFSPLALETVVARLRDAAFARLRAALLDAGRLRAALAALRDYSLLGRGDLFQAFLEGAGRVMAAVPAAAPHARDALARGPWAAAAAATAVVDEGGGCGGAWDAASTWRDGGGGGGSVAGRLASSSSLRGSSAIGGGSATPDRRPPRASHAFGGSGGGGDDSAASVFGGRSVTASAAVAAVAARGAWGAAPLDAAAQRWTPGVSTAPFAPLFALTLTHRAQAWAARRAAAPVDGGSGGVPAAHDAGGGGGEEDDGDAAWARWWPAGPASPVPAARLERLPRAAADLFALGAARTRTLRRLRGGGDGAGDTGVTVAHPLLLAAPPRAPSRAAVAGAAWLQQSVAVSHGFLLRASVALLFPRPQPPAAAGGAAGTAAATPTASFAVVLQREHALCLGRPAPPLAAGAAAAAAAAPPGGFAGIGDSLVVHVLVKRLPPRGAPAAAPPRFRVVAAVYGSSEAAAVAEVGTVGDDDDDGDGGGESSIALSRRSLLASGAVMERALAPAYGEGAAAAVAPPLGLRVDDDDDGAGDGANVDAWALRLAVEYVPPSGGGDAGARGTLRVVVLDEAAGASASAAATVVIETQLTLEHHVRFLGLHGPGRGRAWLGLTAESGGTANIGGGGGGGGGPLVALRALDVASYGEAADGYAGLSLAFDAPWPLHVLLDTGALAVYGDVTRLLLTTRRLSLQLSAAWKQFALAPGAAEHEPGSGGGRRRRAVGGVSAQLSGAAGRRDSAAAVALRARLRQQAALAPVALLRSRLALLLDALQYHVHMDVVDAAHARLHEAAFSEPPGGGGGGSGGGDDFRALVRARDAFLREIAGGAFLSQPSLAAAVERCLAHAAAFVSLAGGGDAVPPLADLLPSPGGSPGARGDGAAAAAAAAARRAALQRVAGGFDADVRALVAALEAAAPASPLLTRLRFAFE